MRLVFYPNTDLKSGTKLTDREEFDSLVLISNTTKGAYLKIHRLPDGPNTTFKIDSFTLANDVRAGLENPKMLQADYTSHSVLVTKGIRND